MRIAETAETRDEGAVAAAAGASDPRAQRMSIAEALRVREAEAREAKREGGDTAVQCPHPPLKRFTRASTAGSVLHVLPKQVVCVGGGRGRVSSDTPSHNRSAMFAIGQSLYHPKHCTAYRVECHPPTGLRSRHARSCSLRSSSSTHQFILSALLNPHTFGICTLRPAQPARQRLLVALRL